MVLRPFTVINSAELIQRMGVTAINGCLEMDLQGQVNSSHVLGDKIMAGIGGTYDYARNSPCSIFIARSTTKGGKISTIVPIVSHVDHTEHDVDVLVTEQGLADLRGLDPTERAERSSGSAPIPTTGSCCRTIWPGRRRSPGISPSRSKNPTHSICASSKPAA